MVVECPRSAFNCFAFRNGLPSASRKRQALACIDIPWLTHHGVGGVREWASPIRGRSGRVARHHSRVVGNLWRRKYNGERPSEALGTDLRSVYSEPTALCWSDGVSPAAIAGRLLVDARMEQSYGYADQSRPQTSSMPKLRGARPLWAGEVASLWRVSRYLLL